MGLEETPEHLKKWEKKGNVLRKLPDLNKFIVDGFKYCQERDTIMKEIIDYYFPYHNITNYKDCRQKVKVLFIRLNL